MRGPQQRGDRRHVASAICEAHAQGFAEQKRPLANFLSELLVQKPIDSAVQFGIIAASFRAAGQLKMDGQLTPLLLRPSPKRKLILTRVVIPAALD